MDSLPNVLRKNGSLAPIKSLPLGKPEDLKASSFAYHLVDEDQAFGVSKLWQSVRATKAQVIVQSERWERMAYRLGFESEYPDFLLTRLLEEVPA